jgi:hypothetical protein
VTALRNVAALKNDDFGIATHILAALGEEDLGARGNCEEEMLVASGREVMLDVEAISGALVKSLATPLYNLFNSRCGCVTVLGSTQWKP